MKTATVSDFRANMKEHLEEVQRDQDVLILSGPKKKDFVVITLDQYNAMEETAYLQSSPANAAKLMESIEQDKANIIAHSIEVKHSTQAKSDTRRSQAKKQQSKRSHKPDENRTSDRRRVSEDTRVARQRATKKRDK
jgi:antitoxin YefM